MTAFLLVFKKWILMKFTMRKNILVKVASILLLCFVISFSMFYTKFNPLVNLEMFFNNSSTFLSDFFPPKFKWIICEQMLITLGLSFVSTFLGAAFAFLVGILSSNLVGGRFLSRIIKLLVSLIRNIPDTILAFLFFISVGLGLTSSFLALFFISFTYLVRIYVTIFNNISDAPFSAIDALGGHLIHKIKFVLIPYSFDDIICQTFDFYETNVRSATIIGMLGGGGIGFLLLTAIKSFNYDYAMAIIISIAFIVILINLITKLLKYILLIDRKAKKIFLKWLDKEKRKIILLIFFIVTILVVIYLKINFSMIFERGGKAFTFLNKMLQVDFMYFDFVVLSLIETLFVCILGTFLGTILGLFFAIFASNNTCKNKVINILMNMIFSFVRSIPCIVWVLLALVSFGLGYTSAILGITISSSSYLARGFSRSFDSISTKQIEPLISTGANNMQIFLKGILPNSLPKLIAWIALRLEINFAVSIVLGAVGVGGIGYIILNALYIYNFGYAGLCLLMIIICAFCLELLADKLSKKAKLLSKYF